MKTFDEIVKQLQEEAYCFLRDYHLEIRGVNIIPKEIEVYYYKEGDFEDEFVHCNELQKNRPNQFYIHRFKNGVKKTGTRASLDFCVSNEENVYYTYLLRSVEIDGDLFFGPNTVYRKLTALFPDIENEKCVVVENKSPKKYDVFFSERVNLTSSYNFRGLYYLINGYIFMKLRLVVCDENFRNIKYRHKEQMVVDFVKNNPFTKDYAIDYVRKNLGYVPKVIKEL